MFVVRQPLHTRLHLSDYRFTPQRLDVGGAALSYLDEGPRDAPAVVMVHGNPTWSYYFRHVVLALRDRVRCIAPDHVGMGLSDRPNDSKYEYTLSRRVADLERLLDHTLAERKFSLLVHDWGGMIGLAAAVRRPEQVDRIAALNTAAFPMPADKKFPWQLTACRLPVLGAILVRGFNAFCRGAVQSCVTRRPLPPEAKRGLLAPYDSWNNRRAVHRFVQDIPLRPSDKAYQLVADTDARLPLLADRPIFLGWGMRDFVFDATFLAAWERRFPRAETHCFEDCGHYILEDAREEITPLLARFFTS